MWRLDGVRGDERRQWFHADRALDEDMKALRALPVPEGAPRPFDPPDAERSADESIAQRVADFRARFEQLSAHEAKSLLIALKIVPSAKEQPDWPALYRLLVAQREAEAYEDGDGDETHLPAGADELVDQWEQRRAEKKRAEKERNLVRTADKGGAARRYSVSESFSEGETIEHPKLGRGIVLAATDKLRVRFADGDRQLAHVKQAPTEPLAPAKPSPARPPSTEGAPLPAVRRLAPDPLLGLSEEERDRVLAEREEKAKALAKAAKKPPT